MNQAKSGGYKFLAIKDRNCLLGSNGEIALEDREALLEVQEEYALRCLLYTSDAADDSPPV